MSTQEAVQQKFEAKLKEADAQIDKLAAQAENAQADTRLQYEEQVKALRSKRDEIGQRISKLNQSGADAAREVQSGVENAWNEFATSLKSAQSKFN